MDQHEALQYVTLWRTAVWTLRVAYVALVVVIVGIVVNASGGRSALLAVGVVLWLVTAVTTAVCFMRARAQLPEPRPVSSGSARCCSATASTGGRRRSCPHLSALAPALRVRTLCPPKHERRLDRLVGNVLSLYAKGHDNR